MIIALEGHLMEQVLLPILPKSEEAISHLPPSAPKIPSSLNRGKQPRQHHNIGTFSKAREEGGKQGVKALFISIPGELPILTTQRSNFFYNTY